MTNEGTRVGDISVKLCECGCGEKTKIIKETNKSQGRIKGVFNRFINGHGSGKQFEKGDKNPNWKGGIIEHGEGYLMMRYPEHPRANGIGYVYLHRLKAEKALGKPLPSQSVVHHYGQEELVICEDNSYHLFLHRRARSLRDCGYAHWRKCKYCKKYDNPKNLVVYSRYKDSQVYHPFCVNQYQRMMRLGREL